MDYINDLYEISDTLAKSLKEANEKIRSAGGKLTPSDMDFVDKLTHAIKCVETTIAMKEATDGGYSRDDRGGYHDGASYDGGSSYARGRGRNANRDSMGRYSSRGYSRDDDGYSNHGNMIDELRDLMHNAPDDRTRQEMQRLIDRMEQR